MIICSISLDHVNYIFPELEYKFEYSWAFREPRVVPQLVKNEPFKASREYEYSEEEKAKIIENERKKQEEKEKLSLELLKRKNTPGYCNLCGAEHAEYIPFEGIWMCNNCYWDSKY